MRMLFFLSFLCCVISLMFVILKSDHMLMMLIGFEMLMLSTFFHLLSIFLVTYSMYSAIVYLVFAVCEASVGLSIMILMSLRTGNEFIPTSALVKC